MNRGGRISEANLRLVEKINLLKNLIDSPNYSHIDYVNGSRSSAVILDTPSEIVELHEFSNFQLWRKMSYQGDYELIEDTFYEDENMTIIKATKYI